jgi:hypothetical protein
MPEHGADSLIGVRPACGCISAWLSLTHSTEAEVASFHRKMEASGREVREANLEDIRDKLDRCPHHPPTASMRTEEP